MNNSASFECSPRKVRFAIFLVFLAGFGLRVCLLSLGRFSSIEPVEPVNIARSLIDKGSYADPYGDSTGPSAHCLPLHPLLVASIIKVFGPGPHGKRALTYVASAAASLGYALLIPLAVRCGFSATVGIGAGLFGALLPVNFWSQTSGIFDAPFSFLAFTGLACLAAGHLQRRQFSPRHGIMLGLAGGISALLNAGALVILLLWLISAWVTFPAYRAGVIRYSGFACLAVVLMLSPWAIRNKLMLGKPIFTRSNFGLEFQVSNNEFVSADVERNMKNAGWQRFHPYANEQERNRVRALGEVVYNREKFAQAMEWIRHNKFQFAKLTIGRIALFWFPRMVRWPATLVQGAIMIFAAAGVVRLWKTRPEVAAFLCCACIGYSLIYVLVEVSARYRYPIEGFLILLASFFIWSLTERTTSGSIGTGRVESVENLASQHN